MPPFEYKPFVNPYVGSIAQLMGAGDTAQAEAFEKIGAIKAREAEQRGQAWATGIQKTGAGIAQGIGDWRQEQIDAPIRAEQAELRGLGIEREQRQATRDVLADKTRDMFNVFMQDPTLSGPNGINIDEFLATNPGVNVTLARELFTNLRKDQREEEQAGHTETDRIENAISNTADSVLRSMEISPDVEGDPESSLERSLLALVDLRARGTIDDDQVEAFIQGNANHAGGTLGFLKDLSYGGTAGRERQQADEAAATRVTEAETLAKTDVAKAKVLADGRVAAAKARADVDLKIAQMRLDASNNTITAALVTPDNQLGLTPGQRQAAMARSSVKFETLDKVIRENQKGDVAVIDDEMAILMAIIGETDITKPWAQTEIRDFYRQIYNAERRELGEDELDTDTFTRLNDAGEFHRGTYLEQSWQAQTGRRAGVDGTSASESGFPFPESTREQRRGEDDTGNGWNPFRDSVDVTGDSPEPPLPPPDPQPRVIPSVASPVSPDPITGEPETEEQRAQQMRSNVPGGESLRAIPGRVAGTIGSMLRGNEGPRQTAAAISRISYDAQDHNGLSGLVDYVKTHRDKFENANIDTEKYLAAIERKIILAANPGGPTEYVGPMARLTGS